ncbi:MAG: methylenetetrahydrofolate reductase C-terminal domain-containing protein, partial [bacterium]|nr:methylenetetrahydrofolate reductase C-terminal domain-containing protein [bacterium]
LADILVRGLGYRGVDLAGLSNLEDGLAILEMVREMEGQDWRESYAEYLDADGERDMVLAPKGGFYLFPEGKDGLLSDGPFQKGDRSTYAASSRTMAWLHRTFFEPDGVGYDLVAWAANGSKKKEKAVAYLEQAIKGPMLGCEMCGDCRIADLQYLCPEPDHGCAKRQLNGPCGGTDENGMCEVHPERLCYWGEVIQRALRAGQMEDLYRFQIPKDASLLRTSSWRNEVLGLCQEPLDLGCPEGALPPV